MRACWTGLLCAILLSGCGFDETNALNLQPITSYAIEQEHEIVLGMDTQSKLLTYCERKPEDVLPKRRAKVTKTTFYHPLYSELGKKTIKYWASGDTRYVTCRNSGDVSERTFEVEPIAEYEVLGVSQFEETEVGSDPSFYAVEDVGTMMQRLNMNGFHESVFRELVYRYLTPDTGALYVTFETFRNGRTLDPMLEPRLFPFESGNNEGYVFLTKREDERISLQIGNESSLSRIVLPKLFDGNFVYVDSKVDEADFESDHRQLLKRVILSERPIDRQLSNQTSLSLSKTYGMVLEIWGHVRKPVVNRMSEPLTSEETRLALYSSAGKEIILDGPKTEGIFRLLTTAGEIQKPSTAKRQGTLTIHEDLTEQSFAVWRSPNEEEVYLVDQKTNLSYQLSSETFFESVRY